MKLTRLLLILMFVVPLIDVFGAFREAREFPITNVAKESANLISNVDKDSWVSLNVKDSALSVTVSMHENEGYRIDFVVRFESVNSEVETSSTHQSIDFIPVTNATKVFNLSQKGIAFLEDRMRTISGVFIVKSELNRNANKKHVSSIQKVACDVASKQEVVALIGAYFKHIDRTAIIRVDRN